MNFGGTAGAVFSPVRFGDEYTAADCTAFLLPPAFWLGVWQLGAWLVELHVEGRGNELLLPYPATVLLALFRLARSPEFWWTALASLARIAAGMAGGAVLGGLLAALTCTSP